MTNPLITSVISPYLKTAVSNDKSYINTKTFTILIADDDENACYLMSEALAEVPLAINLYVLQDGSELLDYLYRRGQYSDPTSSPRPNLILLDLNMPCLNGKEALAQIKSNSNLKHIPIVVITTSKREEDILDCYKLGANSFIVKPLTFKELVNVMKALCHYWFEIVTPPPHTDLSSV
ncbi:response regulator [Planktothrix sp. FACHB-1355]|uniref:Response regulator n=1 Tax=Aerosakkonema funiforme FACHB-1375 TaxID=2949571 RepID=A0A926VCP9_9CYAN|nr:MULTISPECIES: response regulator [Oscillatoriales]MBD2180477.1 response regulator [Aerosakkonema funiforme FACHB-1375]MBD3560355.1 response regulator [Planktothrix sp. FACHB-1355]